MSSDNFAQTKAWETKRKQRTALEKNEDFLKDLLFIIFIKRKFHLIFIKHIVHILILPCNNIEKDLFLAVFWNFSAGVKWWQDKTVGFG